MFNRGCSLPLQRVLTDFGADVPFAQAAEKVREHYGIVLPVSTIRRLTQHHAKALYEDQELATAWPTVAGSPVIVAEMDGGMVPVVEPDPLSSDKRKGKTLLWKEARLCLAHRQGSTELVYGGTFSGGISEAGQHLYHCAVTAGFGKSSQLHAVGDGAPWIADEVEGRFGGQGSYLVDFYHLCEYLAAAAKSCAPQAQAWLTQQKDLLKTNQSEAVLQALHPHLEPDTVGDEQAPVRKAYRYISNRRDQLDYQGAIHQKLPIGSGEIESAHRYVAQQRLKRPGAWWTPDNVDYMLALRLNRANHLWSQYWRKTEGVHRSKPSQVTSV